MRALVFASLASFAVAACGDPDPGPTGPTGDLAAVVNHYDYTFDLDTRAAHTVVTAMVTDPGDCFGVPFRALDLDKATVLYDGEPATSVSAKDGILKVCGAGHEANDMLTVEVDATVDLATLADTQVGYTVTEDHGDEFTYMLAWIDGCDAFAPCDNRPNTFATYHFTITHPADTTVRCPGTVTDDSPTQTSCDFNFPGGPTYSTFSFVADKQWVQADHGMWGGVHVTLYDKDGTDIPRNLDDAYHSGYLDFMESTFGPFPYGDELRLLVGPTYFDGFEHPNNIVLSEGVAREKTFYKNNTAHTIDHEMTHMWAGDQTTLAGVYDFCWKESMAEYLPFTYEDTLGDDTSLRTAGAWKVFASAATQRPVPDDHPALVDFYGDVYGAGPMILFRQLEVLTSRDQVIAGLQTLLGQPRTISIDDVVAALATSTGLDLTGYAQAWLHGSGAPVWPEFDLDFVAGTNGSQGTLTVTQTNDFASGCAFHVALVGADPATQTVLVPVDTFRNGSEQAVMVDTPPFTVMKTILDPKNECLAFPTGTAKLRAKGPHPMVSPEIL